MTVQLCDPRALGIQDALAGSIVCPSSLGFVGMAATEFQHVGSWLGVLFCARPVGRQGCIPV